MHLGAIVFISCVALAFEDPTVDPDGEVVCLPLPCPFVPCEDKIATYYWKQGKLCRGCDQCNPAAVTESPPAVDKVRCLPLPCPPPIPCPHGPWLQTYYWFHGKLCPGCDQCLPDDHNDRVI